MPDGMPAPLHEVFPLRGARIYVAGHRGMVGGACARHLAAQGAEIITADRATVEDALRRQLGDRYTVGGLLDNATVDYRHEATGDVLVSWYFGRMFLDMAKRSNIWAISSCPV